MSSAIPAKEASLGLSRGGAIPQSLYDLIERVRPVCLRGRVTEVRGTTIRASCAGLAVGDVVRISTRKNKTEPREVPAFVTAFEAKSAVLSPLGTTQDIAAGGEVVLDCVPEQVLCSSGLIGSVVDSTGRCIWRSPDARSAFATSPQAAALSGPVPAPFERVPIQNVFRTGIRALDAFATVGVGQRLAVFAEPGVGKSSMVSMIARFSCADVNVVGLIGERGREIGDFAEQVLNGAGASRSVVVASTSADPPRRRIQAAQCAMRIAEYFRDQGLSVLLQIDSLTRLLRAYREVGLGAGEIPVRRGYPSSAFSELPLLIERAGRTKRGAITALYTVLLSSELDEDPMVEEIRGLTDGHIVLATRLAQRGVYPALDIARSLSRLAPRVLPPQALTAAQRVRSALLWAQDAKEFACAADGQAAAVYAQAEQCEQLVCDFCRQGIEEKAEFEETLGGLERLAKELQGRTSPEFGVASSAPDPG
ncbi:MAG TPA: FliI/YscN family ATPase [Oligoflexia bacterium]|nr:FliI/YscN family ATPase [Oligoflexia bacterium]